MFDPKRAEQVNHMEKQTENQKPDLSVAKLAALTGLVCGSVERCAWRSLPQGSFNGKIILKEGGLSEQALFRVSQKNAIFRRVSMPRSLDCMEAQI